MSFKKQTPIQEKVKLTTECIVALSNEKRLKMSLAYRAHKMKALSPEELGTAEHRPPRGLVYDAPLGLKF